MASDIKLVSKLSFADVERLVALFTERNLDGLDLHLLIQRGFLTDLLDARLYQIDRDELRRALYIDRDLPTYTTCIDYSKTERELISEANCEVIDDDVGTVKLGPEYWGFRFWGEESYRVEGKDTIIIHLLPIDVWRLSQNKVRGYLDRFGLRPLQPRELLAFGIHHPLVQKDFPIGTPKQIGVRIRREGEDFRGIERTTEVVLTPYLTSRSGGARMFQLRSGQTPYPARTRIACTPTK